MVKELGDREEASRRIHRRERLLVADLALRAHLRLAKVRKEASMKCQIVWMMFTIESAKASQMEQLLA